MTMMTRIQSSGSNQYLFTAPAFKVQSVPKSREREREYRHKETLEFWSKLPENVCGAVMLPYKMVNGIFSACKPRKWPIHSCKPRTFATKPRSYLPCSSWILQDGVSQHSLSNSPALGKSLVLLPVDRGCASLNLSGPSIEPVKEFRDISKCFQISSEIL